MTPALLKPIWMPQDVWDGLEDAARNLLGVTAIVNPELEGNSGHQIHNAMYDGPHKPDPFDPREQEADLSEERSSTTIPADPSTGNVPGRSSKPVSTRQVLVPSESEEKPYQKSFNHSLCPVSPRIRCIAKRQKIVVQIKSCNENKQPPHKLQRRCLRRRGNLWEQSNTIYIHRSLSLYRTCKNATVAVRNSLTIGPFSVNSNSAAKKSRRPPTTGDFHRMMDAVDGLLERQADMIDVMHEQNEVLTKLQEEPKIDLEKFRAVCSVKTGDKWPAPGRVHTNAETHEVYMTPVFEKNVLYEDNMTIFCKVAHLVKEDIKTKCPEDLKHSKVYYTHETLIDFAKDTFHGFKPIVQAQVNEAKAAKAAVNGKTSRWTQRHATACSQLLKATGEYEKEYGVNPTDLLANEYMSDYASGPEDDDELKTGWKLHMAKLAGFNIEALPEDVYAQLTFWEHIRPCWRSQEFTDILYRLKDKYNELRTEHERKMVCPIRVMNSGHNTVVPATKAPYNFGIDEAWWNEHQDDPEYTYLLSDWNRYEDPAGFGSNKLEEAQGDGDAPSGDTSGEENLV
ncbi:uncharacterized protein EV420DRAFT_1485835 [Desarmillaria tabescens]|uniref:Uncharacterized protein n=1 Tax=Armillaria tabescens TaxID=1929756 RepID=A0AA39MNJ5_ARMTA|nr:uncharacterized protein EV420DRAFT_1485835 [Desarmillaria tabescens]KAK0440882.1 hypothetical protein EV420DRAFT_1485835 [Desarmillaria tabescens]